MDQIAGWPYMPLSFDASGKRLGTGPIRPDGLTDLVVISHGWHGAAQPALDLYTSLLTKVAPALPADPARKVGVVGIFWPADEFNDDLSRQTVPAGSGGAASLSGGSDVSQAVMLARARAVAHFLGDNPEAMAAAANTAQAGADDADAFVDRLRALVAPPAGASPQDMADHKALLSATPGRDLLDAWSRPFGLGPPSVGGGAAAIGQGGNPILDLFFGARSAVVTALNTAAYFEMKARAGAIGAALSQLLEADGLAGVRLHLIGHSFGARLVTAAANGLNAARAQSLTLLQGAFSHNALGVGIPGVGDGFYRGVVANGRVRGPITITHTWNDTAVGFWYPLASRASNTVASGFIQTSPTFGGAQDPHGGMGANGAISLAAGEGGDAVYDGASALALQPGHINNLHCNAFIHAHTDVDNAGCGRVVAAAMR